MRTFTTADKPARPPVPFNLDGREMTFTAPGWAPILFAMEAARDEEDPLAALRGMLDWLGAGLSEADGKHILDRLRNAEDPFDVDDAVTLVSGLIEEVTGRPTTPPSDSSPSPTATDSTDGRHQGESTPASSTSGDLVTSSITT